MKKKKLAQQRDELAPVVSDVLLGDVVPDEDDERLHQRADARGLALAVAARRAR
jgi:hypothetical protein